MAKQVISSSDSGAQAAGKINDNFTELYNGQGGGGGSDIISRNADAVARVMAAKKHVKTSGVGWKCNSTHNFCVAHGSDFHTDLKRWKSFLAFADGVDGIDLILNTGDNTAQGLDNGAEEMEYMMDALDEANISKPYLPVAGNHDRYSLTNAQVAAAYKLQERGLREDNNNCYYYYDVNNNNNWDGNGAEGSISKIRFIVLNAYDVDATGYDYIAKDYHFTQTQIDWFIDVLENTPSTTAVVVCMHGIEGIKFPINTGDKAFYQRHYVINRPQSNMSYEGTIIEDIIEAFRTKENINKSFSIADIGTVTAETNFSQKGHFICYMVGHFHADITGYSYYHPNQLYLVCPCSCITPDYNNSGVLNGSGRYSYGNEVGDMPRVDGTKTEDCFNVYGIDTINKIVKVVRVGSDVNDLGQLKQMDYYPYTDA